MKKGFDNDKYLSLQSEQIRSRIDEFGGKLYLEFGGKIFDDYHASRVLPGFLPDSKMKMLIELKDEAEMIIAINANDPETPLAEALKLYADAAALLAWCDKILAQAKLQMEEIDARMPHTVQANEDEE